MKSTESLKLMYHLQKQKVKYDPHSPYSASKASSDHLVYSYIRTFKINIKVIRCNNVYGPNQYPEKLIPKFKGLLKDGKKCTIHGSKSATVKRAFMHVDAAGAESVSIASSFIRNNIASDDELTVMEVTQLIIEIVKNTTNYDEWITYIEDRPFNDQRYYICAKKLKNLGWFQKKTRNDLINFLKV